MASGKKASKSSSHSDVKETSNLKCKRSKITEENNQLPITPKFSDFKVENIVKCLYNYQLGVLKPSQKGRMSEQVITEKLRNFYVYAREDNVDFDRRITALQFHPNNPHVLAIGTKSGQLAIRFLNKTDATALVSWDGIGPGGSVTYITFDPLVSNSVLISSIDGTVRRHNYFDNSKELFLNTNTFLDWYCSVNASKEKNLIVTGDTKGNLTILGKDLNVVSKHKIHKGKVNSIEFSKSCEWLIATASLDKTVKIWDVRKIDANCCLKQLHHNNAVNSAVFSQVSGNRLLTTDQCNELRVYTASLYDLETLIIHPHRQFQHLTNIKASWHPLSDLVVIGRYPDPSSKHHVVGEARTVDIISAETGLIRLRLDSVSCGGIMPLNVFNANGEILASAMGRHINYWKAKDLVERNRLNKVEKDTDIKLPLRKPPKTKNSKEKNMKKFDH